MWTHSKQQITKRQHKECDQFARFSPHISSFPPSHSHYHTDSPINIRALMYVPEQHMEKYGSGRMEPGVNLYSRRVLIQVKESSIFYAYINECVNEKSTKKDIGMMPS